MERILHRVTCKAALFDRARRLVLLVEYRPNEFGLPGGHLDENESPEAAMRREIKEELGIDYDQPLVRKDFWIHDSGKVILGFIGDLDSTTKLTKHPIELRSIQWVSIDDIQTGKVSARSYDSFIISNSK